MMDRLAFYYPEGHEAHALYGHPERPERVEVIRMALEEAGWWQTYPKVDPLALSEEFLSLTHDTDYLRQLKAACERGAFLDADTYTTPASWHLAVNAAGGAVAVAEIVWNGQAQRGLALTRPPGHHATRFQGMGFCLLNNVAIAANYLIVQPAGRGAKANRLAIIDLDLHHGNGTQDIFWERGDVFYISTHQSPLYPGSGSLRETGAGLGTDCTANFPMPPFTGDEGFSAVMQQCILPLLDRFRPEMLLVSFGFDPHWRDPLGNLLLSAFGYGNLVKALADWADQHCSGKIALFLEGGYDLEAAQACALATTAALIGLPFEDALGPPPYTQGQAWRSMISAAREKWRL